MKWIIAAAGALAAFLFAFASDAGHGGPHEGDGATVYAHATVWTWARVQEKRA